MNIRIPLSLTYFGFTVAAEAIRMQTHSGTEAAVASHEPPFDLVLDVGAFVGDFALSVRQQGYAGKIVSFEAVEASFRRLKWKSDSDGDWDATRMALREVRESVNVLVSPDDPRQSVVQSGGQSDCAEEQTDGDTLDNWLAEKAPEKQRIFLSLDTRKDDLAILKGAINSLPRITAIQIKVDSAEPRVTKFDAALSALTGYGYEIVFISPVDGYPHERNCTFIRK